MKIKGIILIADGKEDKHGDKLLIDEIIIPQTKVPIHLGFDYSKPPIGTATLEKDGHNVNAILELDLVHHVTHPFSPVVGLLGTPRKMNLLEVSLCPYNADSRIKPTSQWEIIND